MKVQLFPVICNFLVDCMLYLSLVGYVKRTKRE
jgi:hypothetical protein